MKFLQSSLLLLLSLAGSIFAQAQRPEVLWSYNLSDGSTIHSMSDNGKWAVAYGVSEATSAYSFPKLLDFTTHTTQEIL